MMRHQIRSCSLGAILPLLAPKTLLTAVAKKSLHVSYIKLGLIREFEVRPDTGQVKADTINLSGVINAIQIPYSLSLFKARDCPQGFHAIPDPIEHFE